MVLRSAWIPAPPPESLPAMVRTLPRGNPSRRLKRSASSAAARPGSRLSRTAEMTAMASAPASMTGAALSRLMPPMATIGMPIPALTPPALQAREDADILAVGGIHGAEADVVGPAASARSASSRSWVETPMILSGPSSLRASAGSPSSWPRCTPSASSSRASSRSSLTMKGTPELGAEPS